MISPNLKAFLDMIAWSEIGPSLLKASDNGYNVLVGAFAPDHMMLFSSYADHPRVLNSRLHSTAAGRYQLLERNFDFYKAKLNLPDFSPASQDSIAIQQIRECHALPCIEAGAIETAISQCAHIWASLPGNAAGQRQNTMADLQDAFAGAGGILTS